MEQREDDSSGPGLGESRLFINSWPTVGSGKVSTVFDLLSTAYPKPDPAGGSWVSLTGWIDEPPAVTKRWSIGTEEREVADSLTESVQLPPRLFRKVVARAGANRAQDFIVRAIENELRQESLGELLAELEDEHGPTDEGLLREARAAFRRED